MVISQTPIKDKAAEMAELDQYISDMNIMIEILQKKRLVAQAKLVKMLQP